MASDDVQSALENAVTQRDVPIQMVRSAVRIGGADVAFHPTRKGPLVKSRLVDHSLRFIVELSAYLSRGLEAQGYRHVALGRVHDPCPCPRQLAWQRGGLRGSDLLARRRCRR